MLASLAYRPYYMNHDLIHMAHMTDIKYAILIKKIYRKTKKTRKNSSERIIGSHKQKKKVLPSDRELML